ncbi:hypothetical protein W97_06918 [Coniosporium apollinis CBS 100218]|uniref:Uncharacterized protein n=1 Tax=Coniosporium apollinis (strain CBS 100218) TaxID=1168221 RepID=R7Z032_CONA1|nr:uncharacterized protein W97_06918 [Coniosporium apollinis CBS 100218]EON67550.1 hypothetical protein W97_06918 [Coniosporium apollinis CBS 100218]
MAQGIDYEPNIPTRFTEAFFNIIFPEQPPRGVPAALSLPRSQHIISHETPLAPTSTAAYRDVYRTLLARQDPQYDIVTARILRAAESVLAGSLEHFLANTQVRPGLSGIETRTADVYVYLRLVPAKPGMSTTDRLLVDTSGSWTPFEKWLDVSPIFDIGKKRFAKELVGTHGYENQFMWWFSNGKTFRFLELPLEIRSMIYVQALGPVVEPAFESPRISLGHGFREQNQKLSPEDGLETHDAPNYAILHLNKQVYHEAIQEGWEKTWKRVTRYCALILLLYHCNPRTATSFGLANPISVCAIRYVQLAFPIQEHLKLFGIAMAGRALRAWVSKKFSSKQFRSLNTLKHLELNFTTPKQYGGVEVPADSIDRASLVPLSDIEHDDLLATGEILQELIMALTVKHLSTIPKITFSGSVEQDLQHKWMGLWSRQKGGARIDDDIDAAMAESQ